MRELRRAKALVAPALALTLAAVSLRCITGCGAASDGETSAPPARVSLEELAKHNPDLKADIKAQHWRKLDKPDNTLGNKVKIARVRVVWRKQRNNPNGPPLAWVVVSLKNTGKKAVALVEGESLITSDTGEELVRDHEILFQADDETQLLQPGATWSPPVLQSIMVLPMRDGVPVFHKIPLKVKVWVTRASDDPGAALN